MIVRPPGLEICTARCCSIARTGWRQARSTNSQNALGPAAVTLIATGCPLWGLDHLDGTAELPGGRRPYSPVDRSITCSTVDAFATHIRLVRLGDPRIGILASHPETSTTGRPGSYQESPRDRLRIEHCTVRLNQRWIGTVATIVGVRSQRVVRSLQEPYEWSSEHP